MEKKYKRTLVTCALPYANGPVHIGHLAGVYVPADIYVRYLRMKGEDVLYICGSDEHGVPITIKAKKNGVTPQDIVDKYHKIIKSSFTGLGINFDIYSRTTSKVHEKNASDFFKKLYDDDKFITQESEQYFDPQAKVFLADRYITGTCPKCGNTKAYGDQCEKCGSTLSPEELIEPKSALSGSQPEKVKTKHWYLPLDKYEPWLREWILEQHKEWKTNVYGQCKSWIDGGLQPRAVSRDLDWGVPVPVEGAEGKVLYVWFDAPIGYISNSKELLPLSWEKWWKSDETRLIHFIGKDNIVFHCIVFPSMLKAEGTYILPDNVPANEFLNLESDKISTSRNWAVWLNEYLEQFPGQEDVMRYVLCANAPETKDNDFTWKDFQQRNNSELVAVFGNFVNRAVVLTEKYFGGKVPQNMKPEGIDKETLDQIPVFCSAMENYLETFHFREALKEAMNIARLGNKYISDTEPWKVAKTDMDRTASILYTSLQICVQLAIVFEPFLPFTSEKLRNILNVSLKAGFDYREGDGSVNISDFGVKGSLGENFYIKDESKALHTVPFMSKENTKQELILSWNMLGEKDILPEGHQLAKSELLFSKIEDETIELQINRLAEIKKANEVLAAEEYAEQVDPQKAEISFDDFDKMDIRTATVLEAERVPKTDKLLKLKIDTGIDIRVIVSGIAEYYTPEDMVGKQICILANLAPRTIKGIESKGMILMARQNDGKMRFITPAEALANGAQNRLMKITYNKDLKHMNTFGMKVKCACLVEYDSLEELDTLLSDERVSGEMPLPVFHIGGGSNLLFTGDFPGTILHSKLNFISYEIREKEVFVKAGSGVIWDDLCRLCSEKGFWGIENLSYIPGEVGAAAVQNIGAYGVEIKDVLHRVECYDCLEHKQVTFTNEECGYDYRDSKFKHEYKGRYIVTSVVLCLSLKAEPMLEYGNVRNSLERKFGKGNNITLQQVREVIIDIRKSKLPAPEEIGSAGSFFRNPFVLQEQYMNIAKKAEEQGLGDVPHFEDNSGLIKIPAAWLIEQCGFKGCRYGNAGVYEKQPLVLINATGNASPDEILALENKIIDEVKVRFGIILIPETEHI